MSTDSEGIYREEQEKCAKKIFTWLVVALVISLLGAVSITFKWWPCLSDIAVEESTIQNTEEVSATENSEETKVDKNVEKTGMDPRTIQYLAWGFAAWSGASIYLMGQVGTHFPKIKEAREENDEADFKKYQYWYMGTFLKAPILAVVIMWFLINLKMNFGEGGRGVAIDFGELGPYVTLGIAFVLGFYGRVARKQLDIIAKYLFSQAWALAEQGFYLVIPSQKSVLINDTYTFTINPPVEVNWYANLGTITEQGVYQAPTDISAHGKEVLIQASRKDEPSLTDFIKLPVKAIRIKTDSVKVEEGEIVKYSLETKLEGMNVDTAKWTVDGEDVQSIGKEYSFDTTEKPPKKYNISVIVEYTNQDPDVEPSKTSVSDSITLEVAEKTKE